MSSTLTLNVSVDLSDREGLDVLSRLGRALSAISDAQEAQDRQDVSEMRYFPDDHSDFDDRWSFPPDDDDVSAFTYRPSPVQEPPGGIPACADAGPVPEAEPQADEGQVEAEGREGYIVSDNNNDNGGENESESPTSVVETEVPAAVDSSADKSVLDCLSEDEGKAFGRLMSEGSFSWADGDDAAMSSLNNAFRKLRHRSRREAFQRYYGSLGDAGRSFFDVATKRVWNYNFDKARAAKGAKTEAEAKTEAGTETSPQVSPPMSRADRIDMIRKAAEKVYGTRRQSLEEKYSLPPRAMGRDAANADWEARHAEAGGEDVGSIDWISVGDVLLLDGRLCRASRLSSLGFAMVSLDGTRYFRTVDSRRLKGLPFAKASVQCSSAAGMDVDVCYGRENGGETVLSRPARVSGTRKGMCSVVFQDTMSTCDVPAWCLLQR